MNEIPDDFEYLGWYSPPEARRLLDALERADIGVHAEFHDGVATQSGVESAYGGFGGGAQILVAIETGRRPDVDRIHGRLFGSSLPTISEGTSAVEEWYDEDGQEEYEIIEKRQGLASRLDDVESELQELLKEVRAVDEELADGRQPAQRLAALRAARERHRETGDRLLRTKKSLETEIEDIDRNLYGDAAP